MNTLFICALKKGKNPFAFLKNYNIPGVSLLLFYKSLSFRNNTTKKNKPSYLEDLFFSDCSIVRSAKIDWAYSLKQRFDIHAFQQHLKEFLNTAHYL